MIEVKNISKSYGEKNQKILAVDNISFSVEKGEILG
jgi:ABC-type dipeptide/oligopeptide/nickel transport system ATPase subunit